MTTSTDNSISSYFKFGLGCLGWQLTLTNESLKIKNNG